MCRGPEAESVVRILAKQAPTCLVQFPALVNSKQRETLERQILGATRERMLREIGQALETITAEKDLTSGETEASNSVLWCVKESESYYGLKH